MKTARIICTYKCHKDCKLCCNKDWKGPSPKVLDFKELKNYDEIIITGGEPLLFPSALLHLIKEIREVYPTTKIILYTTMPLAVVGIVLLKYLDGITVTIHDSSDISSFINFDKFIFTRRTWIELAENKTLRLNLMYPLQEHRPSYLWTIKKVEWLIDCPLPSNETLFILKEPLDALHSNSKFLGKR